MKYEITGAILEIMPEQQLSENFRKREFVLEVQDGQYPEHIKLQLVNAKCDLIEPYRLGDELKVTFGVRGRGYNKNGQMQYFTNLEAWKIDGHGNTPTRQAVPRQQQQPAPAAQPQQQPAPVGQKDGDQLPF